MCPGQFLLHRAILALLASKWGSVTQEPPMHHTMQYLNVMGSGGHLTLLFASSLRRNTEIDLTPLKQHWEEALGKVFTDREWLAVRGGPTRIPLNQRFKLIQFLISHWAYLAPATINKYFVRSDAACPRCRLVNADILHMLWHCPDVREYWANVTSTLATCTSRDIHLLWEAHILHLFSRNQKHRAATRFLDLGFIVAKRLITKRWKSPTAPHTIARRRSLLNWARAEGVALHREDLLGIRKFPLAHHWDAMVSSLQGMDNVTEEGPQGREPDEEPSA